VPGAMTIVSPGLAASTAAWMESPGPTCRTAATAERGMINARVSVTAYLMGVLRCSAHIHGRSRASMEGAVTVRTLDRVLILSASAGAGHVRAAEALERAFADLGAAREVLHLDALRFTNKMFRTLYSRAYLELVDHAPDVLGWLYDRLDTPWEKERRRLAWDKLNTRPLVKALKRHRPDLVICTHFLPAEIISWLKAKHRLACRRRSSSPISTCTRCGSATTSSSTSLRSTRRASTSSVWAFPQRASP
jgi:hypothetical protein